MPYPNEHAARIKEPGQFNTFRRKNNAFKPGIHAIYGIKNGKSELQALRFDKTKWTVAAAKKWLKDNNIKYLYFEPASAKEMENEIQYRQGQVRDFLEERKVEFTISDESRDRHRTIIPTKAWDLESFRGNPIAGWSHGVYGGGDPDNFIGRWEDVRIEEGELIGALKFEDGETNPLAEKLFRKVQNGTINAVSVGFMPGSGHYGEEEEARGGKNETYYFDSAELVEVSLVGIPSNKNARKKALENGDIPDLIRELIDEALGDEYREDLTLKGLFAILKGGEAEKIEEEETGEEVDAEAREKRLQQEKSINNYFELEEKYRDELKRDY